MSNVEDNPQLRPLIIDIGSDRFRMGWAGEDIPKTLAPSVYVDISDYIFTSGVIDGLDDIFIKGSTEKYLFGYDAIKYSNILKVHEFKKESNYNILALYFNHYYHKLEIFPEFKYKQPLIFIAPFFMTDVEKARLQYVFFNYFKFPTILFLSEVQAILSTMQKTSGVIVNIGETDSYISTVFHGFTNIMARDVFPIAGKEMTDYFLSMILSSRGSEKSLFIDKWIVKKIKEKSSICVANAKTELQHIKGGSKEYNQPINFPDGTTFEINKERFMVSEALFDPQIMKIIHVDYIGLAEAISKVIKTWDRENWEELLSNVILSGGSSLIPGLGERLRVELQKYFSEKLKNKIKVVAASGRENMGWIGASVLYSKNQLKKGWLNNPNLQDSNQKQIDETNSQNIN